MSKLEQFGILTGQGRLYEESVYSLALIYNICNTRLTNYLKKYDLSLGKFNILVAIKTHGSAEGISQVDISKHIIVTPSNMTKLIDKLETDGLVTRSPLQGDRRVNIIKVTKECSEMLDGMWSEFNRELSSLTEGLNQKDQEILSSKLIKWLGLLLS